MSLLLLRVHALLLLLQVLVLHLLSLLPELRCGDEADGGRFELLVHACGAQDEGVVHGLECDAVLQPDGLLLLGERARLRIARLGKRSRARSVSRCALVVGHDERKQEKEVGKQSAARAGHPSGHRHLTLDCNLYSE